MSWKNLTDEALCFLFDQKRDIKFFKFFNFKFSRPTACLIRKQGNKNSSLKSTQQISIIKNKYWKMKILSLLFLFSHGNFIDKKQSSQFLSQRSKCGDACAKDKSQVSFMSDIYELIITYMKLFKF